MVTQAWDKGYECPQCEKNLTLDEDFSNRTWLCAKCSNPIHIHVADDKGNAYTLMRKPAKLLQVRDLVVLGAKLDKDYPVLSSQSANKGQWRLALKEYRAITVDADQHYSVIIGGWSGTPSY
ncbi:hypothetical protein [Pseudomonas sp. S2_H08]